MAKIKLVGYQREGEPSIECIDCARDYTRDERRFSAPVWDCDVDDIFPSCYLCYGFVIAICGWCANPLAQPNWSAEYGFAPCACG